MAVHQTGGKVPLKPKRGDRWQSANNDILWEFNGSEWTCVSREDEEQTTSAEDYDRAMRGM